MSEENEHKCEFRFENKQTDTGVAQNERVPNKMSGDKTSRRSGHRPGRRPKKVDVKAKLERSRQSARECRARKKLRYQYLEDLVANREQAIFALREELEMFKQWCIQLDQGEVPDDLVSRLAALETGEKEAKERKENRKDERRRNNSGRASVDTVCAVLGLGDGASNIPTIIQDVEQSPVPQTVPESSSGSTSSDSETMYDIKPTFHQNSQPSNYQNVTGGQFSYDPQNREDSNRRVRNEQFFQQKSDIRTREISFPITPKSESNVSVSNVVGAPSAPMGVPQSTFSGGSVRINPHKIPGDSFNNPFSIPARILQVPNRQYQQQNIGTAVTTDQSTLHLNTGTMMYGPFTLGQSEITSHSGVQAIGTKTYPPTTSNIYPQSESVRYHTNRSATYPQPQQNVFERHSLINQNIGFSSSQNFTVTPGNEASLTSLNNTVTCASQNIGFSNTQNFTVASSTDANLTPVNNQIIQSNRNSPPGMSDVIRQAFVSINPVVTTTSTITHGDDYNVPSISTLPTLVEEFEYESL